MSDLLIKNDKDYVEVSYYEKREEKPIEIEVYANYNDNHASVFITIEQAKQIRDYLDNILKDR